MNELLFFLTVLLCFGGTVLFYKFFGEKGLYGWIAFAVVFANIEVLKSIDMFGMQTTLGNVLFGTVFLATDILNEKYGYQASRKGVFVGLCSILSFLVLSQVALLYKPNELDFASDAMNTLFSLSPRICLASVSMFLFSNLLDVKLFQAIKKKLPDTKWMWVRNNVATIISQCVENFFFHMIAFSGVYSFQTIIALTVSVSLIEIAVALLDTPFLYLVKGMKSKEDAVEA